MLSPAELPALCELVGSYEEGLLSTDRQSLFAAATAFDRINSAKGSKVCGFMGDVAHLQPSECHHFLSALRALKISPLPIAAMIPPKFAVGGVYTSTTTPLQFAPNRPIAADSTALWRARPSNNNEGSNKPSLVDLMRSILVGGNNSSGRSANRSSTVSIAISCFPRRTAATLQSALSSSCSSFDIVNLWTGGVLDGVAELISCVNRAVSSTVKLEKSAPVQPRVIVVDGLIAALAPTSAAAESPACAFVAATALLLAATIVQSRNATKLKKTDAAMHFVLLSPPLLSIPDRVRLYLDGIVGGWALHYFDGADHHHDTSLPDLQTPAILEDDSSRPKEDNDEGAASTAAGDDPLQFVIAAAADKILELHEAVASDVEETVENDADSIRKSEKIFFVVVPPSAQFASRLAHDVAERYTPFPVRIEFLATGVRSFSAKAQHEVSHHRSPIEEQSLPSPRFVMASRGELHRVSSWGVQQLTSHTVLAGIIHCGVESSGGLLTPSRAVQHDAIMIMDLWSRNCDPSCDVFLLSQSFVPGSTRQHTKQRPVFQSEATPDWYSSHHQGRVPHLLLRPADAIVMGQALLAALSQFAPSADGGQQSPLVRMLPLLFSLPQSLTPPPRSSLFMQVCTYLTLCGAIDGVRWMADSRSVEISMTPLGLLSCACFLAPAPIGAAAPRRLLLPSLKAILLGTALGAAESAQRMAAYIELFFTSIFMRIDDEVSSSGSAVASGKRHPAEGVTVPWLNLRGAEKTLSATAHGDSPQSFMDTFATVFDQSLTAVHAAVQAHGLIRQQPSSSQLVAPPSSAALRLTAVGSSYPFCTLNTGRIILGRVSPAVNRVDLVFACRRGVRRGLVAASRSRPLPSNPTVCRGWFDVAPLTTHASPHDTTASTSAVPVQSRHHPAKVTLPGEHRAASPPREESLRGATATTAAATSSHPSSLCFPPAELFCEISLEPTAIDNDEHSQQQQQHPPPSQRHVESQVGIAFTLPIDTSDALMQLRITIATYLVNCQLFLLRVAAMKSSNQGAAVDQQRSQSPPVEDMYKGMEPLPAALLDSHLTRSVMEGGPRDGGGGSGVGAWIDTMVRRLPPAEAGELRHLSSTLPSLLSIIDLPQATGNAPVDEDGESIEGVLARHHHHGASGRGLVYSGPVPTENEKVLVEGAARAVLKQGLQFRAAIEERLKKNSQFVFIHDPSHRLHGFYLHCLGV